MKRINHPAYDKLWQIIPKSFYFGYSKTFQKEYFIFFKSLKICLEYDDLGGLLIPYFGLDFPTKSQEFFFVIRWWRIALKIQTYHFHS